MEGMAMLVKWLRGLKTHSNSASSALRLLSTCIRNKGDLMEKGHIGYDFTLHRTIEFFSWIDF